MPKTRTAKTCHGQAENPSPGDGYTIGDLARLAQCTLRSVRFYEQQGLLSANHRTAGHHRRYDESALQRLKLVLNLRQADLSLDEIRSVVEVKRRHGAFGSASVELRRMLDAKIPILGERILELERLSLDLQTLRELLRTCEDCPDSDLSRSTCTACAKIPSSAAELPIFRALWSHSE